MEFEDFLIDHEQWFQYARRLKASADIFFGKLEKRSSRDEIVKIGVATYQEDRYAYFQSYMLLTGYALKILLMVMLFTNIVSKMIGKILK